MKFNLSLVVIFLVITVAVYALAHILGKPYVVSAQKGLRTFIYLLPILFLSFMLAQGVIALIPSEMVPKLMGAKTGVQGMFFGSFAGILTPGSPVIDYPIGRALMLSGAGVGAIIAMFVAGKVWSLSMFFIEASILGFPFTIIHYLSTFTAPFIAGFVGQWLWTMYTGSTQYYG